MATPLVSLPTDSPPNTPAGPGIPGFTDLPPHYLRPPRRLPDYSANFGYFFRDPQARVTQFATEALVSADSNALVTQFVTEVLVQDFPIGARLSGNAPPGKPRMREYPATFGANFFRQANARVTQFGLEVATTFNPNALITQFGLEVIVALFPQGAQLSGNPPAPRLRSLDYTFAPPISPLIATFVQTPNPGDSTVVSSALPPKAPCRASDYTWFNPLLPQLAGQDALLPDHSTDATALPTPAAPRSRDYTFTASYFQGLIGQDAVPTGAQLSGNAPPGPLRASTLTDPGANYVIYLTAPPPPHPVGLATDLSALYPRAPTRAADYTWLRSLPIHLIGQDRFNPGAQVFELPPRGPARARDYTWVYTLPGQFPPPAPPLPQGKSLLDLPPYAAPILRGGYPHNDHASLALLAAPSTTTEQFQAVLII